MLDDTICAAATAPVNAPIGIIRTSGPASLETACSIFSASGSIVPRKAVYGSIMDADEPVDDVVLIYYKAPASFTGEDMVEIFSHGNRLVMQRILSLLTDRGLRTAGPGEFSKRAFLNGKIDLTEAEAINRIITARSQWEIDTALKQMHGSMRERIHEIRDLIIRLKADIEAAIDFSQEDIVFIARDEATAQCQNICEQVQDILIRCESGERLASGIRVTIAGKPNVGKSSVMNLLLNQERAIVSEIPGTTRDLIRESLQVQGMQLNIIDTAGVHAATDEIEKIGIDLTHREIDEASIILVIIDASRALDEDDEYILAKVKDRRTIYVINKSDVADSSDIKKLSKRFGKSGVLLSAKKGRGLKELREHIAGILKEEYVDVKDSFVADVRILEHLRAASKGAAEVLGLIQNDEPPEIVAFAMQSVLENLGGVTGEISPDDVLDSIFSRFCIGK